MRERSPLHAVLAAIVLALIVPTLNGREGDAQEPSAPANGTETVQKTCPVMIGNKIDLGTFTEYKGKRVYFCCQSCKAAFEAEPEKYVGNLPRFSEAKTAVRETPRLTWYRLIVPFGISALSLLALTFLAGWFMRINRKLLFKWHRRLAIATLIVALCHLLLVILFR